MKLIRLNADTLQDEDIRWLVIGCRAVKWRKMDAADLVRQMTEGDKMIFRVAEEASGIAVLSVDVAQEELWVDLYAGKGLFKAKHLFDECLRQIARAIGLKRITGYVGRDALGKWYEHHGLAKPIAMVYSEELS